MRGLGITPKQRRYAYNIMNTETTKKEAVLASGYSESMARNPIKIENSNGFKLAMAGIFAQSGNVSMAILNELDAQIQAGKLKEQEIGKLINYFDVMTRAMDRIAPKDSKPSDDDIIKIFANVTGDVSSDTDSEPSQGLTSNAVDLTEIASDVITESIDK